MLRTLLPYTRQCQGRQDTGTVSAYVGSGCQFEEGWVPVYRSGFPRPAQGSGSVRRPGTGLPQTPERTTRQEGEPVVPRATGTVSFGGAGRWSWVAGGYGGAPGHGPVPPRLAPNVSVGVHHRPGPLRQGQHDSGASGPEGLSLLFRVRGSRPGEPGPLSPQWRQSHWPRLSRPATSRHTGGAPLQNPLHYRCDPRLGPVAHQGLSTRVVPSARGVGESGRARVGRGPTPLTPARRAPAGPRNLYTGSTVPETLVDGECGPTGSREY